MLPVCPMQGTVVFDSPVNLRYCTFSYGNRKMDELLNGSLTAMASQVRSGKVRSADLVRGFLDRISKVNGSLNAVINVMAESAMKNAEKADVELRNGKLRGVLHGVPVTIKDSLDTRDAVTTWGTLGRREFRPGRDATCVARLRDAGVILLGKTNTPEFTLSFQTDNLLFGATANPWDLQRTPGGSSGGAAAVIAAGASPLDIGTDTGGSIRLPSHFTGITGIKPTTGRVPCTGNALPSTGLIAPLSQPGPMARYVEDLVTVLNLIKGPDLADPHAVDAIWYEPSLVDVGNLRIGYHIDNGIKTPDPDIAHCITDVIELLGEHGIDAIESRPAGIEMSGFIMSRVFSADGGEMLYTLLEDCRTETPSPSLTSNMKPPAEPLTDREFAQTIHLWQNYQSSMLGYFEEFDILICPVNAHTAILQGEKEEMEAYTYTSAFNLCGWPATVIRAGTDSNGLPVGIQIVSRPFREDHSLALAAWLEARLGTFPPPAIHAF